MSLIPNLSEIPELGPVAKGFYDLRVTSAKHKKFDTGAEAINLSIEVIDEENAETVWHKLWLPTDKDEQSKVTNKWRQIKDAMEKMNLDFSDATGLDYIAFAQLFEGAEFNAELDLEPDYRNPEKFVNIVKM
jgi:hypothetical protein